MTTTTHVTALDGLVTVNSLFTVAVFIGLSLMSSSFSGQQTTPTECKAGYNLDNTLVIFQFLSFSFFLFSSLVALGLKLDINLRNYNEKSSKSTAEIGTDRLRWGTFISVIGSFLGCVCLILAMTNIVHIRLGFIRCGDRNTIATFITMCVLILSSSGFYVFLIISYLKRDRIEEDKRHATKEQALRTSESV